MPISSKDVINKFYITKTARKHYDRWANNRSQQQVVERVLRHESVVANEVKVSEIEALCQMIRSDEGEHALGHISKNDIAPAFSVRDWRPNFAFSHLFHFHLEERGNIFSFNEFRVGEVAKNFLYDEAREIIRTSVANDRVSKDVAKQAVTWRLGNAYYSFIKEQYVCAVMRGDGANVLQHPLADALFRVDAWVDDSILALFVKNPIFREDALGRKTKMENIYKCDYCGKPIFESRLIEMNVRTTYGDVHLPPISDLKGFRKSDEDGCAELCRCQKS